MIRKTRPLSSSFQMFVRNSKFRHVFGLPAKKGLCYEGFRVARTAHDPSLCAVNPWFVAMAVESTGGGAFIVILLEQRGRVAIGHPKVRGHSAPITDLKWNPFDPSVIASSSEDCTVKLWRLPFDGLQSDLSQCSVDLRGHSKRVTHIEWHPTAKSILLSASTDLQCIIWNTELAAVVRSINVHPDVIWSISWNRTGSLIASTCRDRRIRVIDPLQRTVVAEGEGHEGSKASRVVFLNYWNWFFTTGYSRGSQRQIALWDADDLSQPIRVEDVDSSSGILIPFFDPDTSIMYLAGKGDGNIRFYEILSHSPHIVYLGQFLSNFPQCGLGMMPKWGVNPYKCELVRFYKLHSTKDLCEPISMIAPRKSERFQEDIFPPTSSPEPSLKAEDWLQGHIAEPKKVTLKDIGKTLSILFPGAHKVEDSDDRFKADDFLKSGIWPSEPRANGNYHHATQEDATEDGAKISDDEDAGCFQRGMVRLNIGKFDQETSNHVLLQRPSVTDNPWLFQTTYEGTELKTSSYQLKMSVSNGVAQNEDVLQLAKKNEPEMDFVDGVISHSPVQLRHLSSPSTPLSSPNNFLAPPKYHCSSASFNATMQEQHDARNQRSASPETNRSQENGTGPAFFETQNILNQLPTTVLRSPVRISMNEFRIGSSQQRPKSVLPVRSRHPFLTARSPEGSKAEAEKYETGMIDFISTEAPDDTLIKPSVLRTSMRTRRHKKDMGETGGNALRRTASLREPRTRSFWVRRENGRQSFEDGKPVQNLRGSSTTGNAAGKDILKTMKDPGSCEILKEEREKEERERDFSPSESGKFTDQHRFQLTLPSFQDRALSNSGSVSEENLRRDSSLSSGTFQRNMLEASSSSSSYSGTYVAGTCGGVIPYTVPETVQEPVTGTTDARESMRFRSATMERWKLHYERLVGGEGGGGGGASSGPNDLKTTPKSQENITMTTDPITIASRVIKMEPRASREKDSAQNKTLCGGDKMEDKKVEDDEDKNRHRNEILEPGRTEIRTYEQRPGCSDEKPPTDYQELLTEFVEQRQLIRRLRDKIQTRDRTIQRLEKQLSLLLRQTISLPSLGNYE